MFNHSTNKRWKTFTRTNSKSSLLVPCGGRFITAVLDESSMGLHMLYEALQKWLFSAYYTLVSEQSKTLWELGVVTEFTLKNVAIGKARSFITSFCVVPCYRIDVWRHLGLLQPLFTRQLRWSMQRVGKTASWGDVRAGDHGKIKWEQWYHLCWKIQSFHQLFLLFALC